VLSQHPVDFPEDAVPFRPGALDSDRERDAEAIRIFSQRLEAAYRPLRDGGRQEATVVAGDGAILRDAAQDVAEIFRREGYRATILVGRRPGRGLEDIRLLERLWGSELCAFVLGPRLSDVHVALAMAHAHGIPSIRLQHDPGATECSPSLSGLIRWRTHDEMLVEFVRQLRSYIEGLVRPVDLARSSSATEAARSIGTMKWRSRAENLWDVTDGPALIRHVHPSHSFVRDEVGRARAQLRKALGRVYGREESMQVCAVLYDGLRRHRLGYEHEAASDAVGTQAIRTPTQITTHRTATCIDVACLFASLLEAASQDPLVVVLEPPGSAHALAGYRVRGEPPWEGQGIGDLRGAVARGDAVLFEATGVTEADEPVGAEPPDARVEKLLGFMDARDAAARMLARSDMRLKHFVDVRSLRAQESQA
jgi:hypothetical protein